MDRDAVNGATVACLNEVLEPRETHGVPTVGDSRRAEFGLARKRLHVSLPGLGGITGAHVSLRAKIGLVEAGVFKGEMISFMQNYLKLTIYLTPKDA